MATQVTLEDLIIDAYTQAWLAATDNSLIGQNVKEAACRAASRAVAEHQAAHRSFVRKLVNLQKRLMMGEHNIYNIVRFLGDYIRSIKGEMTDHA